MKTTIRMGTLALALALLAGLAPRAEAADLTLGASAYLNASGQLISDSGATVLLTKTSGAGSRGDPYVFDISGNLNMGSYTIRGNSTHALTPYSATWRVTGNVTGTGNFDSHTTLNSASGGHVWIEAGGSIAINRVGTYVSYWAHGGNVYLQAMGTVTVASWIDTRSDAGESNDAGSVRIRSEGPVSGQGIAINGNTGGYSILTLASRGNVGQNGGAVALYCQNNITLAAGINTGPGKGYGGSVRIRGDFNDSGLRAGAVSIGGANGLRTGSTISDRYTSGNVTIRAASLQLTGKIDTTQNAYWGETGNVDIDVLENVTIGGFIDTRLLGSKDGSPGFVKIVARRTRVEGVDASGFSIRTWPGGTGGTRNEAVGDADVTLTNVNTSAELYDSDNPTNSMTSSIYVAGKIDTGRWYSDNALGSIRITAVEVQLGSNVTHATLPAATGATPTLAIRYGVTTYGVVTHLKENGVYWNGSGGHNITYTTDRGAYTFTADVPYAGKTGGAVPANIQNRAPSGVATAAATFNGYLVTNGTGNALVYVVWGQTNGAVSGSWAYTNAWTAGGWTNGSYPSTNMTLEPNTDYYYTFVASNAFGPVVATGAQYLITGELTVQATDPTGRVNAADSAAFTVYRPASCTNEDLVVNYSLGGTAARPADYTIAPVSGAVVIAKGQTNGVITVTPVFQQSLEQNVILTLEPGRYAIGSPSVATCTLAAVAGTNRFWVASGAGNWNDAANWSFASGGPAGYSAPGSASMATFDGNGAGDCAINATVNVAGLQIASGYGGVISQGVYTVTVGTNGWTQAGGTFAGYTTDATKGITLGGNFNLSGGTFTSPAGTLLLYRSDAASSFTHSGGTFNHGNGTVEFKHGQGAGITVSTPATTFHNLTVNGARQNSGQAMTIGSGNVLTVNNTFTYTAWDAFAGMSCEMNGGTIDVKGDFVIGNASVRHAGTTIVQLSSSGAQSIAGGAANVWLPILAINKPAGEVTVTGTLYAGEFRLISGTFRSTSGTFYVGASDIYVDGTGNWTHTAGGTFEHNNGSVVIRNGIYFNTTHAINVMATETFYNLTIQGARGTDTSLSGDTLVVLGKLSTGMWDNGSSSGNNINNGVIQVHGDVEVSESFNNGGTATVTLTGGNDQSIRVNAGKPIGGTWTIDKSGGTVTLASAVSLSTAGQDLIWTSGGLDLSSYTLTVADDVTIAAGATTLGVTVAGAAPSNGRLTCTDVLTGIANAGLAVTVTATEEQVQGQTYTILSNNSTLSPNQFAPVTWQGSWKGSVTYTANSGKNVTLSGISKEQGSVFRFR